MRIDRETEEVMTEQAMLEQDWMSAEYSDKMKRVFDFVLDRNADQYKGHWKNPIDASIPTADLRDSRITFKDIVEAIEFYTATEAYVRLSPVTGSVIVRADGYYMGPAGDH